MTARVPDEQQQAAIALAWLPHGLAFQLRHPAPWWTAVTLPLILLWLPFAVLVSATSAPHHGMLIGFLLALVNIAVVGTFWYREARLTPWRLEASPDRVRVLDGDRVCFDAPMAEVTFERRGSMLTVRRGRRRVELLAAHPVRTSTLGWLHERLQALQHSRPDLGDPALRDRVRAVVERAPIG